jgi:hypothetical protein
MTAAGTADADPNTTAIARSGVDPDSAGWLRQVAAQVDPRMDRVEPEWRTRPQAGAARACAFGVLLGSLAAMYPHMRDELSAVAEAHPSFTTLGGGGRLATLERIAAEPGRITAWLGPLVGVQDPSRTRRLLD